MSFELFSTIEMFVASHAITSSVVILTWQTLNDSFPWADKLLPGFLGSVGALLWIKGTWPRRIAMVGLGAVMSTYGGAWLATLTGLNVGFAGFLMGLFGVRIVDSIFKSWEELGLTSIVREFIRARLGLPYRED